MNETIVRRLSVKLMAALMPVLLLSCAGNQRPKNTQEGTVAQEEGKEETADDEPGADYALLVLPAHPAPGENFRVLSVGGRKPAKLRVTVSGASGKLKPLASRTGEELPCWRIDTFEGCSAGAYTLSLVSDGGEAARLDLAIGGQKTRTSGASVWPTERGWDSSMEIIWSAWINALFQGAGEQASWAALHEVTRDREHNFLFNYLQMGEDEPAGKNTVIMTPDCADNPFFLRAYFAWKLGLPFGFHLCDRGYLGKNPATGQWITNETPSSKSNPVQAFNSFIRAIMNGVHSGTARTGLDNEKSDYYPVPLERSSLRPGTVFADPYGHTLVLVSWIAQDDDPGLLLAVDAQPDKTIAIKRFWEGNFLFNTSEVVGEPGFKAFRPIVREGGKLRLLPNAELSAASGFVPFSLQQRKMESDPFYLAMERLINPEPLDPEEALDDLVRALHEQLQVRVKSVDNGVNYLKAHPATVIPMPGNANGIFLAGGLWEDFSTPNRDLRMLIAMDAVLNFPERVAKSPGDFKTGWGSADQLKSRLQERLDKQAAKLTIRYTRSDGSVQELTLAQLLARRDALEMAYNPNDGAEIRWGAPEGSPERSTCRRQAPPGQQRTMQTVRKWFTQRLHPPT